MGSAKKIHSHFESSDSFRLERRAILHAPKLKSQNIGPISEIHAPILSVREFPDEAFHSLKLKLNELILNLDQHESAYFEVCKQFKQVFDTPQIQKNNKLKKQAHHLG